MNKIVAGGVLHIQVKLHYIHSKEGTRRVYCHILDFLFVGLS